MAAKKQQRRFVRNLRYISLRLPFLSKPLNPRGQPGDIQALKSDYEEDEVFIINEGNTFEVLTEKQATDIWQKQGINAQGRRPNPTMASLRSEYGNEYDQDQVRVRNIEETKYKVADVQRNEQGTNEVVRPDRENDVNPRQVTRAGSKDSAYSHSQGQDTQWQEPKNKEGQAADYVDNLRSNTRQGYGAQGNK